MSESSTPELGERSALRTELADDLHARRRLENQLKVTFFLTLAVGLIGGAFGDWKIPTIAVCAYAVIGWMITRDEENIERFADSLYYMGFLFTIWGLLFAFAPWGRDVENLSSEQIITQFGIKLITTVIALTARIILIQARASLAEETEETRETLGALAKAMTREIEQTIEEFRKSRDRLLVQAEEGVTQTHAEVMRQLASAHADVQKQMQRMLDDVQASTAALVAEIAAIKVPADMLTAPLGAAAEEVMRQLASAHADVQKQMQRMLDDVQASTAALVAEIAAIKVPADILTAPLGAVAEDLAAETQQLRTHIQDAGAGIARSLAESFERVRQMTNRMDAAVQGLKGFEQLAAETDSAARTMAAANTALQKTFDQTNRLLGELASVVGELQESTSQDVTKIRAAIESTADDLRGLGDTIRQDTAKYSSALTQSIRLLRREIEQR